MALDNPDLPEALGYLRSTALGLSPRGLATKLIIPNDQILYTEVIAPGPDAASRLAQIRLALEGRTPYDVDDLAFDWSAEGDMVQVAVIARETLAEAEAFAAEHRFNPVAFVALPQDGAFQGEPWFGPTALAATLLTPGETVERDQAPVNLQPRSLASAVPRVPEAVPEPEFIPEPEPDVPPAPEQVPVPEHVPDPVPQPEPAPPELPAPEPEYTPEPEYMPEPEYDPQPVYMPEYGAKAEPMPAPPVLEDAGPVAAQWDDVIPDKTALQPEAEEAPMALDVPDDEPETPPEPAATQSARVIDPGIDDALPPMPSDAAIMAFSSRRAPDDLPRGKAGKSAALGGVGAAKGSVPRPAIARPLPAAAADRPQSVARPAIAAPARSQTVVKPIASKPVASKPAETKPTVASKALRGLGAFVNAPGMSGDRKVKPPIAAMISAAPQMQAAAAAVPMPAKPGTSQTTPPRSGIGLGGKSAPVGGKPRHLGLMLTLILLLCLVLVAAWSSYTLAFWQSSDPAVDTAVMESATPAPDDEMLADMQDPEVLAAANTEAQLAEPALEPMLDTPVEAAPQTAADLVVTAGNTPASEPQDEILLATMDAPPNAPDPLALPQADARGDPLPAAQPAPPPFGTVYQFDADGMIRPTPEGIITPEGVLLIAGKPPRVPEPRPADLVATTLPPTLPAADGTTALPVDPALVGKRPQIRPEGLVPAATLDDASLAPAADSRFAGLRPQARPQAILAAGEDARLASAGASLAAQAETAASATLASAALDPGRSKMAVAISRKPASRPRDLSASVEAAVAAAIRAPEPEPETEPEQTAKAPAKNAAPEADNEPEVASVAPSIPTRASVAKQATFKNAINLSKMNLIGVYGSDANRHALIRQANGRFKKVQVGDKIDGGQIAAITATEVRYKKGGKMLTLAMPKG